MEEFTEVETREQLAIIIAIEDYRNQSGPSIISPVHYATNDALAFKQSLIDNFGFKTQEIIYWSGSSAVKSTLENDLKYYISQLTKEHKFVFYYAGHAFFQDGQNLLTCWDTHPFNLPDTTVSIKDVLLDPLAKSPCQQSLLFLDCCSSFLKELPATRDLISNLNVSEFDSFIRAKRYNAIFMSCSPGEKSYSSDILKHGIWTWHLLEALAGQKKDAIIKDYYITDNSLRNYLSVAVPAYITKEKAIKGTQNPFAKIDAANDFLIRKLPDNKPNIDNSLPNLKLRYNDALFRKIVFQKIKKADGFVKGYSVPKFRNSTTEAFVQKVFQSEIDSEIQEVYENTKRVLNLKKIDIQYSSNSGGGSVVCSFFRYHINVDHSKDDISEARIIRQLTIRKNRKDLPDNFDSIFPIHVDELIIPIDGAIDFDDLVNKFENLRDSQGGSFSDNEKEGIMEYITEGGTSIKIDSNDNELIITHYSPMRSLDLIDKSIDDIKRISGYKVKLLEFS